MSNKSWWDNKLSGRVPISDSPPTSPAANVPYRFPSPQQPNVQVAYDPATDQLVSKAISARDQERCPNCMSGNYMAPQGTQRKRCYECGYPIIQQGSGASTGSGPVQASKQASQGGGFQPNVIVGRVE